MNNQHEGKPTKLYDFVKRILEKREIEKRREILQKRGYKALKIVFNTFENTGITAIPVFGTLLGFKRDKMFIAHDSDIDLAVDLKTESEWTDVDTCMANAGFKAVAKYIINGYISEKTYILCEENRLRIDIFRLFSDRNLKIMYSCYKKNGFHYDDRSLRHFFCYKFDFNMIISKIEIKEQIYPSLSNEECNKFLQQVYGKNWMTPQPNWITGSGPNTSTSDDCFARREIV